MVPRQTEKEMKAEEKQPGFEQFTVSWLWLDENTVAIPRIRLAATDMTTERFIGTAELWLSPLRDTAHLVGLFVDPEFRRRGVGQLILRAAEQIGRAQGLRRIHLCVAADNHHATKLYDRAGYEYVMQDFRTTEMICIKELK
jgi:ribosomal protein S18 acetylase RimI-like enzyme